MLRSCDLLVVSAPDFITGYFNQVHGQVPPGYLLENKVLESEIATVNAPVQPRPAGTPWRIGWFAAIRCQQSLHLLADLTQRMPGKVQVVIQGNVVWDNVPDFMQVIESTPGLEYRGTYDRRTDLPVLYSDVHFAWTVDFFGRYGNSDKLLPNRLYEAGATTDVSRSRNGQLQPAGGWRTTMLEFFLTIRSKRAPCASLRHLMPIRMPRQARP